MSTTSSSRRDRSTNGNNSRRPSGYENVFSTSYREQRFLSVPSASAEHLSRSSSTSRRGSATRDNGRRGSLLEVPAKQRARSLSPLPAINAGSRFKYKPLDPEAKRAIRVLEVRPDLYDGMIACDLEHTTTKDAYSALSYTWGSSTEAKDVILLNGYEFPIRRNLHAFLEHARKNHAGKVLWVDAICINQDDIEEKNRQVKMMSRIYSETKEVLVWLGPRTEYVGHAIRRMQAYEDMSDTEMALSSSRDEDFWKGFKAINKAPYWDRVWVIQEFVQPVRGRIIQGERSITFETFQNTIRRFDNRIYRLVLQFWVFGPRRNEHFDDYISNIHPLWKRRIERSDSSSAARRPDDQWALLSGTRRCQDIRDRVYGIMPLATNGSSLNVDYHLTPFEVLLESIWLEHDSEIDRTEVLRNLANILMLTPAAICQYAQKSTSRADRLLRKMPPYREARKIHLKAASSAGREDDWLLAAAPGGRKVTWKNFAVDQVIKMPKGLLQFPTRKQCPWNMFVYSKSGGSTVGLKMAVDSRSVPGERGRGDDRENRKIDAMSEEEFLKLNRKNSMALGVYKTTCSPFPLTIYYAMVEGLDDMGKDNKIFWVLEGLDDLDIDL